ncbi:hypothetical protein B0H19DRAFT_1179312 [Mycena capillaripes]|nr:hypothetical protein B0H19DRAFT_1179312 [Mycena capillaripes]
MDAYFPVTKSSTATSSKNVNLNTKRDDRKYKPYTLSHNASKDASKTNTEQPSVAAVTKFLLSTLKNESNPITNSDCSENATYVFSTATGHQVSEGSGNRRLYLEHRAQKISVQTTAQKTTTSEQPPVLMNTKCYISGFLENTTDLEMKRIISSAGGKVLPTASNATHIITSQHLSGSKTHHFLTTKSRSRAPHVVRPEWVTDSIEAGKRRSEREYSVIKDSTTKNLFDMLQK